MAIYEALAHEYEEGFIDASPVSDLPVVKALTCRSPTQRWPTRVQQDSQRHLDPFEPDVSQDEKLMSQTGGSET